MPSLSSGRRALLRYIKPSSLSPVLPIRRTASKAAHPPLAKASPGVPVNNKSPTARSTPSSSTSNARLSPRRNQQLFAAKQLYEHGIRNIYTAPSHFGTLAFSWLIGVGFVGKALSMLIQRYDQLRPGHGYGNIQKTAVEAANRLGMIFLTVIGGYSILRYKGLIRSLDLIRVSGVVQLRVSVRRIVPFLKPKEYIVPSYDLQLPYKWRFHSEEVPVIRPPNMAGTVGRIAGLPFRKFRQFLTKDGILAVNFEDGERTALLDTRGEFTRSMGDLEAISEEREPWR